MVLFLAINTANVTLLPTHVMALRAAVGSHDPAAIIPTTLFATIGSTGLAVVFAKWGCRWFPVGARAEALPPAAPVRSGWLVVPVVACLLAFGAAMLHWGRTVSPWILPAMIAAVLAYGALRRVPVYEAFVEGAKEGLEVSLRIIPYLVAILVAVGMFQASGAMDLLVAPIGRLATPLGLPPEAMTMAVLRSLSGSASFGYLASLLKDAAIGPDSYLGILVSTIYGSSETTFYVLAVYFGAAGIRRIRHALIAGLLADLGGVVFAVAICRWLYG
jgi:spore maturation protein SpmB